MNQLSHALKKFHERLVVEFEDLKIKTTTDLCSREILIASYVQE
jgi:hypothetical protein